MSKLLVLGRAAREHSTSYLFLNKPVSIWGMKDKDERVLTQVK